VTGFAYGAARDGVIEPNPLLWAAVAGWLLLGVALVRLLPRIWQGESALTSRLQEVFGPLGPKTSQSAISSLPAAAAVLLLSGVLLAAALVREVTDGPWEDVANAVALAITVPFLLALVAFFGVVLFNRPKFLVPPALRDRRGLLL
jgi:hypothetical protein